MRVPRVVLLAMGLVAVWAVLVLVLVLVLAVRLRAVRLVMVLVFLVQGLVRGRR